MALTYVALRATLPSIDAAMEITAMTSTGEKATIASADCMVGICSDGVMKCAAMVCPDRPHIHEDAVKKWLRDPNVTQILRVPVEIPRKFLFVPWPGLEAALATVAAEAR